MKDQLIRIRVEAAEKAQINKDALASGFDDTSSYLLHLARRSRSRLRK